MACSQFAKLKVPASTWSSKDLPIESGTHLVHNVKPDNKGWNSLQRVQPSSIAMFVALCHDFVLRRNVRIAIQTKSSLGHQWQLKVSSFQSASEF
jgi:hypothetical protein